MPTELAKQYAPREAQERWLKFWNERGFFHSDPPLPDGRGSDLRPFTIVIPPPNVTGALHMGHALNNTLQDVLIRWRRMQGYNALWMPGTDHAGIATQAVVERLIFQQEKKTRHDLGREELVQRIWQWKEQYEARILGQLKQLGCSCDWRRTRFTLDEVCSRAVRQTFFDFFKKGLIFRGKRLVNWDTQLQTSVADDETFHETVKGNFWTFKYPVKEPLPPAPLSEAERGEIPEAEREGTLEAERVIENRSRSSSPLSASERGVGGERFIRFSTTRPETMLGDTAVAVHPNDERYKHLIGKMVTIPLVNRDIPIIADGILVDPELGTGAVKVTPAHDPNDYQCGLRHKLPMINILNPDGTINENGGKYAGLDRFEARKRVTADMEALGLLEKVEERDIELAHSDRSKTPIEPYLSDQWFVRMGDSPLSPLGERGGGEGVQSPSPRSTPSPLTPLPQGGEGNKKGLAQLAMDAVTSGKVKFFPERYAKTYLDWLGEKRDWCISRQLWWGHRIPIWYARCSEADLKKAFGGRSDVTWRFDEESDRWLVCPLDDSVMTDRQAVGLGLTQDPDVLDTWFSSALWPHSTLGWPEQTAELKYYYPTNVLVTARGIITLWVARMVMAGLFNRGEVPFHHVYIYPTILDAFGETMSKMKGNGVDPLDIIALHGTDALRFSLTQMATETQEVRMPVANVCPHCGTAVPMRQEHMYMRTKKLACPSCKKPFRPGGPWRDDDPELPTAKQTSERFEIGRNFANKLWNAARFVLMNLEGYTPGAIKLEQLPIEDRWILSRLATTASQVTEQLEGFKLSDAARTLYDFTWSEFCDWYVEMSKARLARSASDGRSLVQRVLVGVLDSILRLLHPIIPFVTESIWQALGESAFERGLPTPEPSAESVMIAPWPNLAADWRDADIETRIARMQTLVRAVRNIRNEYNINERATVDVAARCQTDVAEDFQALSPFILPLAKVGKLECGPDVVRPPQSAAAVHADFEAFVGLKGLIDVATEVKRQEKQKAEKERLGQSLRAKLANAAFVDKAPPEVVAQVREQLAEMEEQIEAIKKNLEQLRQG